MDTNKLKKLKEIKYTISACGLCSHSTINPTSDWGICNLFTYSHNKHTGEDRKLSINRHGACPSFEPNLEVIDNLHGFMKFIQ